MLLEVGGHGRVAAQSLPRTLESPVTLHDPGATTGLLSQHTAAAWWGRRRGRYRVGHGQTFGLLAGRGEVRGVALENAADVV